jgi:hypothetical protein
VHGTWRVRLKMISNLANQARTLALKTVDNNASRETLFAMRKSAGLPMTRRLSFVLKSYFLIFITARLPGRCNRATGAALTVQFMIEAMQHDQPSLHCRCRSG